MEPVSIRVLDRHGVELLEIGPDVVALLVERGNELHINPLDLEHAPQHVRERLRGLPVITVRDLGKLELADEHAMARAGWVRKVAP